MKLTLETLKSEYAHWTAKNGLDRNDQDLRFGQMIHITYDIPSKADVFYVEKADKSYNILLKWLEEQTEKAI